MRGIYNPHEGSIMMGKRGINMDNEGCIEKLQKPNPGVKANRGCTREFMVLIILVVFSE